jgi:hypothetical protein
MPTGSCCTEPEFGRFTRHQCNRDYLPPCTTEELIDEGMYLRFKCRVVEPLIEIIIALLL